MEAGKVFITGAGGMLGNAIYPYFAAMFNDVLASDKDVNEDWLVKLDVRDDVGISNTFKEYRPSIVLHLAAETNLEFCETHPDVAIATNVDATETIAKLSKEYGSTLIYISTAGVFDGTKKGLYTEEDNPNPIMVYGQTKYDGELKALKYCPKTYVVRAGWMMGGGRNKEKKFIYKILQQIAAGKKTIYAVDNRWGTPTYTYDFAMNLFKLLKTEKYGTYHMVCEGDGTRYDVAKEILHICNRDDITLTPVESDYFKDDYFAPRPVSEMMYNKNLRELGIHNMRPWKESLNDYIHNYFFDHIYCSDADRKERRKHIRKSSKEVLVFTLKDNSGYTEFSGVIIDKSVSGIGILTSAELKIGQVIKLDQGNGTLPKKISEMALDELRNGKSKKVGMESLLNNYFCVTNIASCDTSDFIA
ncbi:MAG: NAD(P)-dependent oxidoreductase [Candidatus Scalindua rubra]|uniref:dTDP-4-dehydrorhamnose reductase n=1 Tax=Candidatus Scalindua brodae TaxID=237368 RepID=A0A0B0EKP7_9BACT|nr:MAG: dTDP-4-dehydrorhamnose reductase [Candidatus Scalindua brodae]MBZ0107748.1 NAD(P)-dependent oxidoreductase [Candidatus Scalindua rubra]TWU35492.1 dTDP-4-dehydrorhamnose reductase [Candidatus Brocadiaceae bacterium S225]